MTQPPEPPPPPDDAWPTPDEPTVVSSSETLVNAPPPEPVGPPPDRRIGTGMLLALGALALVAGGIALAWYLTHRDDDKGTTTVTTVQTATVAGQVAVPDLTGKPFPEAQATLDAAGLHTSKRAVSSDQPAGTVVGQKPQAGASVAKGSTVTISVASAAASTGTTTAATTTQKTTTEDTTTGETTTRATTTQATTTQATTTAPTTTAPAQPTSATMPDVTGRTEAAASTALNRAGVLPSIVFVPGDDPLGTVVQQAKAAGTSVPYHSHVQINVSKGPNATTDVTVPNAIGQTLRQAVSTMNGANLRLIFVRFPVTSDSQTGKVVQQTPLSGGKAPQNGQVLVYLGVRQRQ
jgi:beta-lactam-binding protein with PASTA domain